MRTLITLSLFLATASPASNQRIVDLPADLTALTAVRGLERLKLYVPKAETKVSVPPLSELVDLTINGDLRLTQIDGLASQKSLKRLSVAGLDRESRVDFRNITAWPPVQVLTLRRIRVNSAKALETMTSVERIYLDRVTFDVPVDWSKFPKLIYRSGQ